jgi:hypothetical protein
MFANAMLIRAHYLGLSGVGLREVFQAFSRIPRRGHMTPIEEPHAVGVP